MLKKKDLPYCPITITLQIIGGKWNILILQKLQERPWRFNELRKELGGISKMVLSVSLHSMEAQGIILKKISQTQINYTEYSLTELGYSLIPILKEMEKWGTYYQECYKKIFKKKEVNQFVDTGIFTGQMVEKFSNKTTDE